MPPGRARLAIKPAPIGSETATNTVGIVRLICCSTRRTGGAFARITSGRSARSSLARAWICSALAAPNRVSMRTLRLSDHPSLSSPCRNAANRALICGSSSARFDSTPMRRTRSICCARAATGHAAALPSAPRNSRRFMPAPDSGNLSYRVKPRRRKRRLAADAGVRNGSRRPRWAIAYMIQVHAYRPHNSFDAIRAPSVKASSLAHCTEGWQRTML